MLCKKDCGERVHFIRTLYKSEPNRKRYVTTHREKITSSNKRDYLTQGYFGRQKKKRFGQLIKILSEKYIYNLSPNKI